MKTPFIVLGLAITLFLESCQDGVFCTQVTGAIETRSYTVDPFQGISSGIAADIYVTEGATTEVTMVAQTQLLDGVRFEVVNDVLEISYDRCYNTSRKVEINITIPHLHTAKLSGSGTIVTNSNFTSGNRDLEVAISGSGEMNLNIDSDNSAVDISGSGSVNLQTGTQDQMDIRISGSGDVRAQGMTTDQNITISGSGTVRSFDCPTRNAVVNISSSGDAYVLASDNLSGSISGSGTIYYKGNPSTNVTITGSGDVIDRN